MTFDPGGGALAERIDDVLERAEFAVEVSHPEIERQVPELRLPGQLEPPDFAIAVGISNHRDIRKRCAAWDRWAKSAW